MISLQLSAPSKTFLLGEYLALVGGPALILCTDPRFELSVQPSEQASCEGIHSESPAGKFMARYPDAFGRCAVRFVDPYQGLGGLGASSAQFALCYAAQQQTDNVNAMAVLDAYLQVAWDGQGVPPSGADVIAQFWGGVCYFDKKNRIIQSYAWLFPDVDYCLLHTGKKLATHDHLKALDASDYDDLAAIVKMGSSSLVQRDSVGFAAAITAYAKALQERQLVADYTQDMLMSILQQPGVLAAKGCGALGADIIFVMLERGMRARFTAWTQEHHVRLVVTGNEVGGRLLLGQS